MSCLRTMRIYLQAVWEDHSRKGKLIPALATGIGLCRPKVNGAMNGKMRGSDLPEAERESGYGEDSIKTIMELIEFFIELEGNTWEE